jgi:hypothetical protein
MESPRWWITRREILRTGFLLTVPVSLEGCGPEGQGTITTPNAKRRQALFEKRRKGELAREKPGPKKR